MSPRTKKKKSPPRVLPVRFPPSPAEEKAGPAKAKASQFTDLELDKFSKIDAAVLDHAEKLYIQYALEKIDELLLPMSSTDSMNWMLRQTARNTVLLSLALWRTSIQAQNLEIVKTDIEGHDEELREIYFRNKPDPKETVTASRTEAFAKRISDVENLCTASSVQLERRDQAMNLGFRKIADELEALKQEHANLALRVFGLQADVDVKPLIAPKKKKGAARG